MYEQLLTGDAEQALALTNRLADDIDTLQGETQLWIRAAFEAYLVLGRLEAAEAMAARLQRQRVQFADIAWARGDVQGVIDHLQDYPALRISELPLVGELRWAREFVANPASHQFPPANVEGRAQVVRGQVALADGDTEIATQTIQNGLRALENSGAGLRLLASEALADAWERHGDLEQAVQVLDAASHLRDQVFLGGIPRGKTNYLRIQARRARLTRELGRDEEAARIEAELLAMLAVADDGHQVARELREQLATRQVAVNFTGP